MDETGDITWYNDLINPSPDSKDCDSCCESATVLFSCETFDVNELNPRLIFGAFAGHSIEFKVRNSRCVSGLSKYLQFPLQTYTLTPADTLVLECENWYSLLCKRLKEDEAVGQEKEFTFIDALSESYFSDVIIKSSDGIDVRWLNLLFLACIKLNVFFCNINFGSKDFFYQIIELK